MPVRLVLGLVGACAVVVLGAAHAAERTGTTGPDRLVGHQRGRHDLRSRGQRPHRGTRRSRTSSTAGRAETSCSARRGTIASRSISTGLATASRAGPGRTSSTPSWPTSSPADCEIVSRQLSRDALRLAGAQHETQVEPDSLAVGSTIVTAFQSGRLVEGGAAGIGWATSTDAGAIVARGLPRARDRPGERPGGRVRRAAPHVADRDAGCERGLRAGCSSAAHPTASPGAGHSPRRTTRQSATTRSG